MNDLTDIHLGYSADEVYVQFGQAPPLMFSRLRGQLLLERVARVCLELWEHERWDITTKKEIPF
jgi:hypothetical protein